MSSNNHTHGRPFIGSLLRNLRHEKNLLQLDIANRMAYSRIDRISGYENGKRSISNNQILKLLTVGLRTPPREARHLLGRWLIMEAAHEYNINVEIKE